MSRSNLCENGPGIVEKKYTVAQSIPEIIKKFDPSGVLYAGSSGIYMF
jgi:hypothetical protein